MSQKTWLGYLFILPAAVLIVFFLIYPTIRTIQLSFDTGMGFTTSEFVGLDNYINLFTRDRLFFNISTWPPAGAVFNTILWLILFTFGTVGIGLLVAVLANSVRYEVLIKTIIFVPMAISFTAAGIIWRFVYSPDATTGILNALLIGLIPSADPIPWLGRTDIVNYALIAAGIWLWTGFCMVILSASLKGLPTEVLEAARVDGANAWQTFWRVTFPMLWPTILVITTTMIINVLKAFDLVYIMTQGGPRGASRIIGFSMYFETFQNGKPGYGAAIAVIMLILVTPFVVINIRRYRREERER
ncbi:MAG: binding-protein-dependent transport system inner membrane protein [Chloroflexi bacterium OLB15]|nr:MAG: binding-protein-dependent transport system inner membrane protein [Chloroflexi bacterium OLB15]